MTDCPCYCHVNAGASCTVDGGHGVGCGPHASTEDNRAAQLNAAKRDHRKALDGLTRTRTIRLTRDDGATSYLERVTVSSLLDQLVEALESGAETGTARGVPASKPPTDAGALSLLVEIADTVRQGCRERKIRRRFDIAVDLGALVDSVNTQGDLARIQAGTALLRSWCAQIRATIQPDPDRTWRMHGAACRVCSSTTVPQYDPDGTETRVPALLVHSEHGVIDKVECSFCGSTLTGVDLVALVRDAPRAISQHVESA